jgi:hypothetical protein
MTSDPSAECAIHSHAFSVHYSRHAAIPSAKSSFTPYLVRRIASPRSIPPHDPVCTHVHVVTTLPRTLSQAELIEQIKKPSSKWIKAFGARYRGFSWQRGYAAFSVSPSQLEAVLQYVQRQEEHHRTHTFQDEYRELLRRHNIEFDEQYVWD